MARLSNTLPPSPSDPDIKADAPPWSPPECEDDFPGNIGPWAMRAYIGFDPDPLSDCLECLRYLTICHDLVPNGWDVMKLIGNDIPDSFQQNKTIQVFYAARELWYQVLIAPEHNTYFGVEPTKSPLYQFFNDPISCSINEAWDWVFLKLKKHPYEPLRNLFSIINILTDHIPGDEKGKQCGVSLYEAAFMLHDSEKELAKTAVRKWHNSKSVKLPAPIGKHMRHKQRNIYKPSDLVDFIEKIEGYLQIAKADYINRLIYIASPPRQDSPEKY